MSVTIPIDRAGRIVLPKDVRRQLNLAPGSRLRIAVIAERIELTPEPEEQSELAYSASKRATLKRGRVPADARKAVRSERDAQTRPHRSR